MSGFVFLRQRTHCLVIFFIKNVHTLAVRSRCMLWLVAAMMMKCVTSNDVLRLLFLFEASLRSEMDASPFLLRLCSNIYSYLNFISFYYTTGVMCNSFTEFWISLTLLFKGFHARSIRKVNIVGSFPVSKLAFHSGINATGWAKRYKAHVESPLMLYIDQTPKPLTGACLTSTFSAAESGNLIISNATILY